MNQLKLLKEWEKWSKKIEKAAKKILGDCRVVIFGSVIEGKATGGSDVDILIVIKHLPRDGKKRAEIISKIEDEAGLPLYHPYEIHLVNEEEAKWYLRHITKSRSE